MLVDTRGVLFIEHASFEGTTPSFPSRHNKMRRFRETNRCGRDCSFTAIFLQSQVVFDRGLHCSSCEESKIFFPLVDTSGVLLIEHASFEGTAPSFPSRHTKIRGFRETNRCGRYIAYHKCYRSTSKLKVRPSKLKRNRR